MATKEFSASFIGVHSATYNTYDTTDHPIKVGGGSQYNTVIGFPSAARDAVAGSKTAPKVLVRLEVTDTANFDFGGHRRTSNVKSGGAPWYRWLGLSRYLTPGTYTIDITSYFLDEYLAGDYHGIVLYGQDSQYGAAVGRTGNSNQFKIIIEGTWNTAPSKPNVTAPEPSFVGDESATVQWTKSTDAEQTQSQLQYQIEYYNGNSWGRRTTVNDTSSTTYDITNEPETSSARFRVRAFDGELYSAWDYSDYFTISHNKPPAKPSQLDPDGGGIRDRHKVQRFTWKHNDDGGQAGYRLAYRKLGESWTYLPASGHYNSTAQHHDFPAGTFLVGEYEWTVETVDQQGLDSPWGSYARVKFGEESNAPIINSPASGGTVTESTLVIEWSSIDQLSYEVRLLQGTTLLWSESTSGTNKATRAGYALTNNTTYTIEMRVLSSSAGVWSDWTVQDFQTSFTPPLEPTLSVSSSANFGDTADVIQLNWNNPTGGVTDVAYVEVFKREYTSGVPNEWDKVGLQLPINGLWLDYTPASDTPYEYKVRAWGVNNTFSESTIVEGQVTYNETFLQRAAVPSDLIKLTDSTSRDVTHSDDGAGFQFAGRKKPVWEFGEFEETDISVTWRVRTASELRHDINFIKRKETFLYRDNAGRKMYCVVREPNVKDLPVAGHDISVTLYEVSYKEGRE